MEKELKKTGVTKLLMWKEYNAQHPDGLKSSQFLEHFQRWNKRVSPVMHMTHKAGDKMFIDYAGKTLQYIDAHSGEVIDVQFFVAVLGASQYTYAQACMSQQKVDFITSVENALHFFGGVPQAIVPDNLKSAVTKSNRYEPTLNETFKDFAEHYQTTILPARSYKPKDKALVEGAVKILYRRIYSVLRNQTFYSLKEINQAVWKELENHNNTKLTGRNISRLQLFTEIEKSELSPLALNRYELKDVSMATVMQNGHVLLSHDKHYYSVPYQNIGKKVKIVYTENNVEIFHNYNRIASHPRNQRPYTYSTIKEHLASTHQFLTDWTPQRFIDWAYNIDNAVGEYIANILAVKQHPEQAYKSCSGILSLVKKIGKERLVNACKRAAEHKIYNYKIVTTIIEKGLDKIPLEEESTETQMPKHQNIRGDKYYV